MPIFLPDGAIQENEYNSLLCIIHKLSILHLVLEINKYGGEGWHDCEWRAAGCSQRSTSI
jgi:hypothetical protein